MREKVKNMLNRFGYFMGSATENFSQFFLMSILVLFYCLAFKFCDDSVVLRNLWYMVFSFAMVVAILPSIALKILQSKKISSKVKKIVRKVFVAIDLMLVGAYIFLYPVVGAIAVPVGIALYVFMLCFFHWFGDHRYPGLHVVKLEKFFERFGHLIALFMWIFFIGTIFAMWYLFFGDIGAYFVISASVLFIAIFTISSAYDEYPRYFSTEDVLFLKIEEPALPVCFF